MEHKRSGSKKVYPLDSRLTPHTHTLWQTACQLYEQPGVQSACLKLQDEHNANVLIVLWLCWVQALKVPLNQRQVDQAITLAYGDVYQYVKSVRQLRKHPPTEIDKDTQQILKSQLLNAELTLEKHILEQLEAFTQPFYKNTQADATPGPLKNYLEQLQPPISKELIAATLNWPQLIKI